MDAGRRDSHRDLVLWRKAVDLSVAVHRHSAQFPRAESFGLTSQIRRAAVSIPSNVAEGTARRGTREFLAFLYVARGSLAEVETQMEIARRVGYLTDESFTQLNDGAREVGRLLNALISALKRRLQQPPTVP